eukprot:TRINITY_DN10946_c0_g2_i2.p3 TRINITY_DN10946_c0_g2~~TRINITY_DN10946_c0_g2_i2.p3  ORF type:complete len:133 (+),score=36.23 TRINITY_DN10946_c0_g2_i2:142-540(+)
MCIRDSTQTPADVNKEDYNKKMKEDMLNELKYQEIERNINNYRQILLGLLPKLHKLNLNEIHQINYLEKFSNAVVNLATFSFAKCFSCLTCPSCQKCENCQHLIFDQGDQYCLLYTSPSPRDRQKSRMPSSA